MRSKGLCNGTLEAMQKVASHSGTVNGCANSDPTVGAAKCSGICFHRHVRALRDNRNLLVCLSTVARLDKASEKEVRELVKVCSRRQDFAADLLPPTSIRAQVCGSSCDWIRIIFCCEIQIQAIQPCLCFVSLIRWVTMERIRCTDFVVDLTDLAGAGIGVVRGEAS